MRHTVILKLLDINLDYEYLHPVVDVLTVDIEAYYPRHCKYILIIISVSFYIFRL